MLRTRILVVRHELWCSREITEQSLTDFLRCRCFFALFSLHNSFTVCIICKAIEWVSSVSAAHKFAYSLLLAMLWPFAVLSKELSQKRRGKKKKKTKTRRFANLNPSAAKSAATATTNGNFANNKVPAIFFSSFLYGRYKWRKSDKISHYCADRERWQWRAQIIFFGWRSQFLARTSHACFRRLNGIFASGLTTNGWQSILAWALHTFNFLTNSSQIKK